MNTTYEQDKTNTIVKKKLITSWSLKPRNGAFEGDKETNIQQHASFLETVSPFHDWHKNRCDKIFVRPPKK